jgi:tRNA-dihydrouridine synthase B
VARIAEDAGIGMLTIHGRTRRPLHGEAEYDTIAAVKRVRIPGGRQRRHHHAAEGRHVLAATGADAIMIGRGQGARGSSARSSTSCDRRTARAAVAEIRAMMNEHLADHYAFYGEFTGVRTAASTSAGTRAASRAQTVPASHEHWNPPTRNSRPSAFFDEQAAISDRLVYVDENAAADDDALDNNKKRNCLHMSRNAIDQCVRESLDTYFRDLDGEEPPTSTTWCWSRRKAAAAKS